MKSDPDIRDLAEQPLTLVNAPLTLIFGFGLLRYEEECCVLVVRTGWNLSKVVVSPLLTRLRQGYVGLASMISMTDCAFGMKEDERDAEP